MIDELGSPKTYNHYPNGWAMAFNTPFKMWKRYEFNGGSCDPCMISWPKGIKARGEIRHQYHHAIDIMPTILDCLGVEPPETIKGHVQSGFDGISMRYSFDQGSIPSARSTQFYSMLGSRAIWHEGWKAVSTHPTVAGWSHFNDDTWELYNVEVDRAELHDLAGEHPEKLRELINLWFSEAGRNGAFPLDDRSPVEIITTPRPQITSPRDRYRYFPGVAEVPEALAVNVRNRDYIIGMWLDIPAAGASGVLFAHGSHFGGHTLYVKDNRLHYVYNFVGMLEQKIDATEDLPVGENLIVSAEFVKDDSDGKPGVCNGDPVALPRRRKGRRGANQDPARDLRPDRVGADRRAQPPRDHLRLPRPAAVAVHRRHDPLRRRRRQRRTLRRSRARGRRDDRTRIEPPPCALDHGSERESLMSVQTDVLTSWNPGAARRAVVDFVGRTVSDDVAVEERPPSSPRPADRVVAPARPGGQHGEKAGAAIEAGPLIAAARHGSRRPFVATVVN